MAVALSWVFNGLPSALLAAVSAYRLFCGDDARWILGLILAALMTPTVQQGDK